MYFILLITFIDELTMIPNLDLDLMKTFLAIADTGSFTRAAEEVHKTQSAVSMQMKRLEEVLGRPLFARDGRASRFTPDGERLIEFARRLVSVNDEAVSAFTRPELTGTVRLGTPDDYADRFLPEILARFSRQLFYGQTLKCRHVTIESWPALSPTLASPACAALTRLRPSFFAR